MKLGILLNRIWDVFVYALVAGALGSLVYYIVMESFNLPIYALPCSIIFGILFFLFILREEKKLKSAQDS